MSSEPTVFIVDDDPAARRALAILMGSMDLRAQAYASARGFLDEFERAMPGCLLLDVRMPGVSGLELLDELRRQSIELPVVFLSAHGDVPMVARAMRAGAMNFLEKPWRDHELWEAIQEAIKHDAESRRKSARRERVRKRIAQLTDGERTVLKMLVDGMSNRAIGTELELSVRTIEVRRAKVMQKMKAKSLAELVRLALSAGSSFG